jgi:hypothetical protein
MSQEMADWISFCNFLMSIRWLERLFQHILCSHGDSEFEKNNLTALELQGTISAMKGGGV